MYLKTEKTKRLNLFTRKVRDTAMALRARIVSGAFEKWAHEHGDDLLNWYLRCLCRKAVCQPLRASDRLKDLLHTQGHAGPFSK